MRRGAGALLTSSVAERVYNRAMQQRVLMLGLLAATVAFSQTGQPLTADTPRTTSAGATFTAPAGWSVRTNGAVVVVDAPEGDSHVAIVDAKGADASAAVASAWGAYRPGVKRPMKLST